MTTPQRDVITILEEVAANGGSGQDALDAVNAHLATIETHVTSIDTHATSIDTKLSSQATAAKQDTGNTSLASLDGKLPTAAATADNESNSTAITRVGARIEGFDGTTWDLIRTGITAVGNAVAGFINQIPWAFYNATPTTRTNGQGGPLETDATGRLKTQVFAPAGSFSFAGYLANPPGAGENDPNTTPPDPNRIVTFDPATRGGPLTSATLRMVVVGGTNLVHADWIFDTTRNKWVKLGINRTITVATSNIDSSSITLPAVPGLKAFVQVVSTSGSPTDFYYDMG